MANARDYLRNAGVTNINDPNYNKAMQAYRNATYGTSAAPGLNVYKDQFGNSVYSSVTPGAAFTKEAKAAQKWLLNLLKSGTPAFPVQKIAGMTDTEIAQQALLADVLAGKTFRDPLTSEYYKGIRDEINREEEKGAGELRRRAQLSGMGASTPSLREEGEYRADMAAKRSSILGQLYESESARDNPYTRMAAVSQYGGLPRELEQSESDAQYNAILQRLMFPYSTQLSIAGMLTGLMTQPDVTNYQILQKQQKNGGGWMDLIGAIAPPIIGAMMAPATGGASLLGAMPRMNMGGNVLDVFGY